MATQLAFWDCTPLAPPPVVVRAATGHQRGDQAERTAAPTIPPRSSCTPAEPPNASNDRQAVLHRLRRQLSSNEAGAARRAPQPAISCGASVLDQWLPSGGLAPAAMHEWVATTPGGGARLLSLLAAREALRAAKGTLVVVDAAGTFFPPAAMGLGIAPEQIVWVRPENRRDQVWTIDQALRCGAVAAVWSPLGAWLDDRDARRFQLAAETGNTLGLFVRPAAVIGQPSFAETRWKVRGVRSDEPAAAPSTGPHASAGQYASTGPRGRQLHATLLRCRGGQIDRSATLVVTEQGTIELPHVTANPAVTPVPAATRVATTVAQAAVHLAAQLADPAVARRRRNSA